MYKNHSQPSLLSTQIACKHHMMYTVSQKKVPTFKLSVTLSNLNKFSKILHYWKPYEISYKTLGTLLHYLGKLEIQIFCRYSAIIPDMEENANKLHFKCANFNSSTCVTAYAECIYVIFLKSCTRRWIVNIMLIVDKYCSDICCDEFPMPQIDRKSKQVKEQRHGKFLFTISTAKNSLY